MLQRDALRGKTVNQRNQPLAGGNQRREVGELRADVAIHADNLNMRQAGGALVGLLGIAHGYAKFVGFEPCGDVGVGFCVHIGVDAEGNGGDFAQSPCHIVEPF